MSFVLFCKLGINIRRECVQFITMCVRSYVAECMYKFSSYIAMIFSVCVYGRVQHKQFCLFVNHNNKCMWSFHIIIIIIITRIMIINFLFFIGFSSHLMYTKIIWVRRGYAYLCISPFCKRSHALTDSYIVVQQVYWKKREKKSQWKSQHADYNFER